MDGKDGVTCLAVVWARDKKRKREKRLVTITTTIKHILPRLEAKVSISQLQQVAHKLDVVLKRMLVPGQVPFFGIFRPNIDVFAVALVAILFASSSSSSSNSSCRRRSCSAQTSSTITATTPASTGAARSCLGRSHRGRRTDRSGRRMSLCVARRSLAGQMRIHRFGHRSLRFHSHSSSIRTFSIFLFPLVKWPNFNSKFTLEKSKTHSQQTHLLYKTIFIQMSVIRGAFRRDDFGRVKRKVMANNDDDDDDQSFSLLLLLLSNPNIFVFIPALASRYGDCVFVFVARARVEKGSLFGARCGEDEQPSRVLREGKIIECDFQSGTRRMNRDGRACESKRKSPKSELSPWAAFRLVDTAILMACTECECFPFADGS